MDEGVMVHKANSIAAFFASYPREEAIAGVANHLQSFWEPRMRRQLHSYVAAGGANLNELVIEAERRLRPAPIR
ncbi:MAG TPA: formate dehydrogenase subunit delta [Dehalococcoidia bacterium]|nr:formate dehydrogenase subunit delta [Dehalococcoidia bacterium]